jgi:hypothetical protein
VVGAQSPIGQSHSGKIIVTTHITKKGAAWNLIMFSISAIKLVSELWLGALGLQAARIVTALSVLALLFETL